MITSFFRFILNLVCFPLVGAYGLRWAAGAMREMADVVGVGKTALISLLDYAGAGLGLLMGLFFALQLIPSCCQRRNPILQGIGDTLLLIIVVTFLVDAILPALLVGTGLTATLPPLSLVVWLATGAAAVRLALFRRRETTCVMDRHAPSVDPITREETDIAMRSSL